jgi:hypothetical protein
MLTGAIRLTLQAFKEIGREYGPMSLSAIPIGAYDPREIMKQVLFALSNVRCSATSF